MAIKTLIAIRAIVAIIAFMAKRAISAIRGIMVIRAIGATRAILAFRAIGENKKFKHNLNISNIYIEYQLSLTRELPSLSDDLVFLKAPVKC